VVPVVVVPVVVGVLRPESIPLLYPPIRPKLF
jgi:hypothetical protein